MKEMYLHSVNRPAIIRNTDGLWIWWLHNKIHRYYGPAVGSGSWYLNGICVINYD